MLSRPMDFLCVCQAPNAFTCVSSVAPSPQHQVPFYHVSHAFTCHQWSLLRSFAFARLARTFSDNLNLNSCLKSELILMILVHTC